MNKRLVGCIVISMLLLLVLIGAGYVASGYFFSALVANNNNGAGAIETTKEWAQLSDFPVTASNVTVEAGGSVFTTEFTVEFDAPLADIETWLNESPGTKDVTPEVGGNIRKYSIEPGGGAQHAELELDEKSGHVKINVYWS